MAGLYLHIPFCKQACHYCDFHFSTDVSDRTALTRAIAAELALRKSYLQEPINTIYLGGGTPSLLDSRELENIFNAIHTHFQVQPSAEITLEANPDDLSKEKLKELRMVGINRLSVGIQSFDDNLLTFLNRAHNSKSARQCLLDVRETGFDNISIDLIYAIPGLSNEAWAITLADAVQFAPEHISSYSLTIEDKTVFGNWSKRGKLKVMEEENAAHQFEILMDVLGANHYEHYEISNFCKPGFLSRHNSSYWKQTPYMGVGPSAHSFDGVSRQFNVRNNTLYIKSINAGAVPFEREILSKENKINEYILTTLRTSWGCDLNFLKEHLMFDLATDRRDYLNGLERQGLIDIESNTLRLTRKGKLLADKIAEDLMVSA